MTELAKITAVLSFLRTHDPDMPIQVAHVFLTIALNEGLTQKEVSKLTCMPSSATSRHVSALTDRHYRGKPGLGWVKAGPDTSDWRAHALHLTPRGRLVIKDMVDRLATKPA